MPARVAARAPFKARGPQRFIPPPALPSPARACAQRLGDLPRRVARASARGWPASSAAVIAAMNTSPVPCTDGGMAISGWLTTVTSSRVTTARRSVPGSAWAGAALVATIQRGPRAISSRAAATTSSSEPSLRPTSSSSSK